MAAVCPSPHREPKRVASPDPQGGATRFRYPLGPAVELRIDAGPARGAMLAERMTAESGGDPGPAAPASDALRLAEAALDGDPAAVAAVREAAPDAQLAAALRNRGANDTEAQDIVGDLWADCFSPRNGRPPLLERYNGKGPLGAFLTRTALNRLIDLKRRQKFQGQLPALDGDAFGADAFDRLPAGDPEGGGGGADAGEDQLVGMLRDALLAAFAKIAPQKLAVLKLVAVHRLDQALVGRMWGWSQSKVSRTLSAVMGEVLDSTLAELRRIDPWVELQWEDFIALCGDSIDLFAPAHRTG